MRKAHLKRNAVTAAAAAVMSPLMIASFYAVMPSAKDCIIHAADISARLATGVPGKNIAYTEDTDDTDDTDDTVEETAADKQAYISFDDSYMLSCGELEIPSSENEELAVPEDKEEGAEPYPESLENCDGVISAMTYGFYNGTDYINLENGQIRNVTSVSNDILENEIGKPLDFTIEKNGLPQILIMHTHETESYEPYSRNYYDASFTSRTTDDSKNMAAVGEAIAAELEAAGIGVIHDVTKHDYPSYNDSYTRSRKTVQDILRENPSIKIVLDIHRDAIERTDGTRIAPVTEIDGKRAAQVMIICGCDDGTMNMPNHMKNFRFAAALQNKLEGDYPTFTRPVLFDYRKYNQDLTTGSLLIEVGGHANSIDEAIYSGTLIGRSLADMFG